MFSSCCLHIIIIRPQHGFQLPPSLARLSNMWRVCDTRSNDVCHLFSELFFASPIALAVLPLVLRIAASFLHVLEEASFVRPPAVLAASTLLAASRIRLATSSCDNMPCWFLVVLVLQHFSEHPQMHSLVPLHPWPQLVLHPFLHLQLFLVATSWPSLPTRHPLVRHLLELARFSLTFFQLFSRFHYRSSCLPCLLIPVRLTTVL